jgi:hypothetical protein
LVPASLIFPIIACLVLAKFRPTRPQLLSAVVMFLIPLLPLIVFDLKHNFINLNSIKSFVFTSKSASENVPFLFLRSYWRSLTFLFLPNPLVSLIFRILLITISLSEIIRTANPKLRLFYFIWVITPLALLALYHGNIPEYYYGASLIIYPILIAGFIIRLQPPILFYISLILIIILQWHYFSFKPSAITLENKLNLANYLVHQTTDPIFNLSYDVPPGWNTGYAYIFKYLGSEPQNIPQGHLYSVFLTSFPPPTGKIVYYDNKLGLIRK